MIVTLDDALFATPVEPLLLLSILRYGFEGRHIVLTDPSFQRNGNRAINQWLAERDPLVRDAAEAALDRSLHAYPSTTCLAELRVEDRQQSHWAGTPPKLTPEDGARVLALPLLLVLEDRQADKHFLRCVLPQSRRGELRAALERGWIRAEHGGGLGNMKNYVESLRNEPAERPGVRGHAKRAEASRRHEGDVRERPDQRLGCRRSVGPVLLHEPEEARIRDYLVDGIGLVEALFLELGQAFWNMEEPARRPLAVSENPTAFVTFEVETETFRMSRAGDPLQPGEFALSRLLDASWQHAFSATLRSLPMGPQLQSRFSRLVDVFFGASVAVIRVISEGSRAIQKLLAVRNAQPPLGLVEQGPTTPRWHCDTCGQAIRHFRDGRRIGRGFRLVHHQPASPLPDGCQYDGDEEYRRDQSILADVALEDFLGHDGLTYLLEVLSRGELPQEQVVEMIKRLHTPGYERARFHAQAATEEGVIEPNMRPGFYAQGDIARVLDWADAKDLKP